MSIPRAFFRFAGAFAALAILMAPFASAAGPARAQADDPAPPDQPVKLIFIHHSTGENWLTDGYGNLGRTLGENNYFVSDTNYGWGPDAIGDRTDILNWMGWFRSDSTPTYMEALFNESGQNSGYTRRLADPGGENQIILFKSCFPNSMLEGSPNDPPAAGDSLSVGNAKYIYNSLLEYFVTRPDKLFIVITAPPVQDREYARNARAFNLWLTQDWLRENNYPLNNVAVFDFYNILTHPDNHHRYDNGQIEYITDNGGDTLYYDSSGDDHPNEAGSQKATEEFLTLLNIFYHRWAATAPSPSEDVGANPPAPQATQPGIAATQPGILGAAGLIDGFDAGVPAGTNGWESFADEAALSSLRCAPEDGALHIQADIAPESWGSCVLFYDAAQDWSAAQGLAITIRTDSPGMLVNIDIYGGKRDSYGTYLFTLETTSEMGKDWVRVELPWEFFLRAEWEENAGTPLEPVLVTGMGFGFNPPVGAGLAGGVWIEDVQLIGSLTDWGVAPDVGIAPVPQDEPAPPDAEAPAEDAEEAEPAADAQGGSRLCPGSMALAVSAALIGFVGLRRRR